MNAAVQILDIFFMLWANSKLLLYLLNNLKMILKFPVNFYHQRFKTQFIMNATRAFTQPFGIRKDCIHSHQRGQFPLIPKEVLFEQQSTRTSKVDWTNSQKTSCQKQTSSRADRVLLSPASFFFFFLNPSSNLSVNQAKRNQIPMYKCSTCHLHAVLKEITV